MELKDILSRVDHTYLKQDATWEDIRRTCDEGMEFSTASVCIPASYVKEAKEYVGDRLKICTVIGFPNGYSTKEVKCFEAKNAIENGADEIDTVINIGDLKGGRYEKIADELACLKSVCGDKILKVIIETCLLTNEEKVKMCKIVTESGADYIKTSTGFSKGGATLEDIVLFKENVGGNVKIKAAGGISSLEDATAFINAGASRLGTSRIVNIIKNKGGEANGY
ncbi:MAG: deoxyribose-phosphate aldolase [Clostridia bacterium]|nr:deoxyribose-phosphate aldolase [Clostridia bacterium]